MSDQPADPFADNEAATTLGQRLDNLGIAHDIDNGDYVVGAVVLLKVMCSDGDVALVHRTTPGIAWIEKIGMLRAAEQIITSAVADPDN